MLPTRTTRETYLQRFREDRPFSAKVCCLAAGDVHHTNMNDEKVSKCVAYYRKLLDDRPETPESLEQATRSGLDKIVHQAGAKRRTDSLLARLDEVFAEQGIVTPSAPGL